MYSAIFFCLSIYLYLGVVTNWEREIKKCLLEAYKKTDDGFLQEASKALVAR